MFSHPTYSGSSTMCSRCKVELCNRSFHCMGCEGLSNPRDYNICGECHTSGNLSHSKLQGNRHRNFRCIYRFYKPSRLLALVQECTSMGASPVASQFQGLVQPELRGDLTLLQALEFLTPTEFAKRVQNCPPLLDSHRLFVCCCKACKVTYMNPVKRVKTASYPLHSVRVNRQGYVRDDVPLAYHKPSASKMERIRAHLKEQGIGLCDWPIAAVPTTKLKLISVKKAGAPTPTADQYYTL